MSRILAERELTREYRVRFQTSGGKVDRIVRSANAATALDEVFDAEEKASAKRYPWRVYRIEGPATVAPVATDEVITWRAEAGRWVVSSSREEAMKKWQAENQPT